MTKSKTKPKVKPAAVITPPELLAPEVVEKRNHAAELAIVKSRVKLLLTNNKMDVSKQASYIFFATIAMKLKIVIADVGTAAVDGRRLYIDPKWIATLTPATTLGVLIHEVLHCVFQHFARRGFRHVMMWNIAADLAINHLLIEAGFELPECVCLPGKKDTPFTDYPPGLTAEEYYERLMRDVDSGKIQLVEIHLDDDWKSGKGNCKDPFGCGGVIDTGDSAEREAAAAEMKGAIAQAAQVAKSRGNLPGGLARLVESVMEPVVDWKSVLANFVRGVSRSDYSWGPFNRRFVASGIYLPSLYSPELGTIALAIDVSGSISKQEIHRFMSECQGVLEAYDCTAHLISHDAEVTNTAEWRREDGLITAFEPKGGGGTDHNPVFEWIDEQGLDLACLVCYTDLMSSFPDIPPSYPVLWAVPAGMNIQEGQQPFGQLVQVTVAE